VGTQTAALIANEVKHTVEVNSDSIYGDASAMVAASNTSTTQSDNRNQSVTLIRQWGLHDAVPHGVPITTLFE
jgi:hypothetical protein